MLPRWIGAAQPFAAAGDQIARSASWCAALAKRSWNSTENVTSHSLFDIINSKDVRTCNAFTKEDRQFLAAVQQIIADGRVGKTTIRKVKEAFDKTADPVEMLAILRRDIASQYLLAVPQKRATDEPAALRELILSSYLP
jgi:hypothetical protein